MTEPRGHQQRNIQPTTELWEIISNSYHLLRLGWVLTQQQVTGADILLLMVQSSWIPMQARSYNVEVRWRWVAAGGGEGNQTHYIVGDSGVNAPGFQGHGPCSTFFGSQTRGKLRDRGFEMDTEGWGDADRRKEAPRCEEFCEPSTEVGKHNPSSRNNKQVGLSGARFSLNWLNKNVLHAYYASGLW